MIGVPGTGGASADGEGEQAREGPLESHDVLKGDHGGDTQREGGSGLYGHGDRGPVRAITSSIQKCVGYTDAVSHREGGDELPTYLLIKRILE